MHSKIKSSLTTRYLSCNLRTFYYQNCKLFIGFVYNSFGYDCNRI